MTTDRSTVLHSGGFDTSGDLPAQGVWGEAEIRRGHLRARTLIAGRWMVLVGEVVVLLAMRLGLGDPAPYGACAVVIAAGVLANTATAWIWPKQKVLGDGQAVAQLSFDILQISALLVLVGGAWFARRR